MFKFKLPDIGEGVSEGEIVKWHVASGNHISIDQEMVEVMTDKVTVKIPSPVEGTVKNILFQEGQVVQVGSPLIEIDTGSDLPEADNETEAVKIEEKTVEITGSGNEVEGSLSETGVIMASPAVRRIAREKGIELRLVRGTGEHGRVTLDDLEKYSPEKKAAKPGTQEMKKETPVPVRTAPSEEDEVLEPRGLRRLIFEKMTKSKQVIPHFTVMEEVDLTRISEMIDTLGKMNTRVTFTAFFVKASAVALGEYPYLNAIFNESARNYTLRKTRNIGIAADTPDGLTVPVLMNVERKSLLEVATEVYDLATRAKKGQLKINEVQNSTFTVSNVGTIGGLMSTPIINFPEVAILGVHRIRNVTEKELQRKKTYLSLSCDHRLIDGAMATRFLVRLKEMLENPEYFLVR